MKNKVTHSLALLLFFYSLIFSQCAYAQGKPDTQFQKMMANSFRTEGIANIDRIAQDETQRFCSNPQASHDAQYQKRVQSSVVGIQTGLVPPNSTLQDKFENTQIFRRRKFFFNQ